MLLAAAWLAVALARDRGSEVQLTAEIGLWGYDPVPADPFVLKRALALVRSWPYAAAAAAIPAPVGERAQRPHRGQSHHSNTRSSRSLTCSNTCSTVVHMFDRTSDRHPVVTATVGGSD